MVRNQYNEQLAELKSLLTEMGDLNSQAIAQVVAALKKPRDPSQKRGGIVRERQRGARYQTL